MRYILTIFAAILISIPAFATQIRCEAGFGPGIHYWVVFDSQNRWITSQSLNGTVVEGSTTAMFAGDTAYYYLPYTFGSGIQFAVEPGNKFTLCVSSSSCYPCR